MSCLSDAEYVKKQSKLLKRRGHNSIFARNASILNITAVDKLFVTVFCYLAISHNVLWHLNVPMKMKYNKTIGILRYLSRTLTLDKYLFLRLDSSLEVQAVDVEEDSLVQSCSCKESFCCAACKKDPNPVHIFLYCRSQLKSSSFGSISRALFRSVSIFKPCNWMISTKNYLISF